MLRMLNTVSLHLFFLGRTNALVAVLQLFKVCKESESLYPPHLNGSKLLYCTKNQNLPQLWVMKTFSLWQIYRVEHLWKPNIALFWVLGSGLWSPLSRESSSAALERRGWFLGVPQAASWDWCPRDETWLHRAGLSPWGKRLQLHGVPSLPFQLKRRLIGFTFPNTNTA